MEIVLAIDKRKIKHCLACGLAYKLRKGVTCWKRTNHIWKRASKLKRGVK